MKKNKNKLIFSVNSYLSTHSSDLRPCELTELLGKQTVRILNKSIRSNNKTTRGAAMFFMKLLTTRGVTEALSYSKNADRKRWKSHPKIPDVLKVIWGLSRPDSNLINNSYEKFKADVTQGERLIEVTDDFKSEVSDLARSTVIKRFRPKFKYRMGVINQYDKIITEREVQQSFQEFNLEGAESTGLEVFELNFKDLVPKYELENSYWNLFSLIEDTLDQPLGSVKVLTDKGYKPRFICSGNPLLNEAFRPLLSYLQAVNKYIPTSYNETRHGDHDNFISIIDKVRSYENFSDLTAVDLSGATENLSLIGQIEIITTFVNNLDIADKHKLNVINLLDIYNRFCKYTDFEGYDGDQISWENGNPLGITPSFYILQIANAITAWTVSAKSIVVGDDTIVPTELVQSYINKIESLGGIVNTEKNVTHNDYVLSCSKRIYRKKVRPMRIFAPTSRFDISITKLWTILDSSLTNEDIKLLTSLDKSYIWFARALSKQLIPVGGYNASPEYNWNSKQFGSLLVDNTKKHYRTLQNLDVTWLRKSKDSLKVVDNRRVVDINFEVLPIKVDTKRKIHKTKLYAKVLKDLTKFIDTYVEYSY